MTTIVASLLAILELEERAGHWDLTEPRGDVQVFDGEGSYVKPLPVRRSRVAFSGAGDWAAKGGKAGG
ncbi:MAG: hypothetical protein ACLP01_12625 [Solirubrobacteraceae bacterium]